MPHCERIEEILPNADTPVGELIPRDIAMQASVQTRGVWIEHPEANNPFVQQSIIPSANQSPGEVKVAYANGPVKLIKEVFVDCSPGAECAEIGVSCVDHIEIEMQVSFSSDNGVFAETLVGTVSIPDPRDPDLDLVNPEQAAKLRIQAPIDPITFSGTATLQTQMVRPGFTLTKNTVGFGVSIVEQKIVGANLGSFVEIQQDAAPGEDAASMGAGGESLYTFDPQSDPA